MTCLICTNDVFRGLPMHDQDTLVTVARQVIQGMVSSMRMDNGSLKSLQPKRRGICIVERCARVVEVPCGACHHSDCVRCGIAAELRAAKDRINTERDEELATIGLDDGDVEDVIDKMVGNLCEEHVSFGTILTGEWHGRQLFLAPVPVDN